MPEGPFSATYLWPALHILVVVVAVVAVEVTVVMVVVVDVIEVVVVTDVVVVVLQLFSFHDLRQLVNRKAFLWTDNPDGDRQAIFTHPDAMKKAESLISSSEGMDPKIVTSPLK